MQHVPCTKYVVIGSLLSKELQDNQKIRRGILIMNSRGRVTVYHMKDTFILECDTTGDHNPNDYYFFKDAEEAEIYKVLASLGDLIGEADNIVIEKATKSALEFIKN